MMCIAASTRNIKREKESDQRNEHGENYVAYRGMASAKYRGGSA